ncbi:MAG: alkaline phosphatase family protein [Chloroflexota bacterium]
MPAAKRAFVMVWDGMRPDLVSPELTPNLAALGAAGVRFQKNHAVFPTVTRINSASLWSGTLPIAHGIVGNSLYAPKVDPTAAISIGDHRSIYKLIEARGGRLIPTDTVPDRIHAAGGKTVVVSTGSPGSAFLCHPRVRECDGDRVYNQAVMLPDGAHDEFHARTGSRPDPTVPNTSENAHFTRAAVEWVLPDLNPTLMTFWHTDPDKTQHHTGFGSPQSLESIRDADRHLGEMLEAYDQLGIAQETVFVVVSDHGYSTIDPVVSLDDALSSFGLADDVAAGRLVLSPNGFTVFANVTNGDADLVRRAAEAFMAWEHAGSVFTGSHGRPVIQGSLPLESVGLGGELAPDVACAMAWDHGENEHGLKGRSAGADSKYLATHGGISPWEITNTLIMAGPGLKQGLASSLPSGNIDVAPTLLHLLGISPPAGQHGRILTEALADGPNPASISAESRIIRAARPGYRQEAHFSSVGNTTYLDYGQAWHD